ncbi:MAG: hypothetical protein EZS28_039255 [Streblomastix strix]|uniref:Uncharacterized protein n=1 Tax=Streblomastix strix TaxID=222440 RepID=A0A5J4U4E5_9EUKA|nr:MAG: hypothetical protein EZS28_039255 [Streblomastix strix]
MDIQLEKRSEMEKLDELEMQELEQDAKIGEVNQFYIELDDNDDEDQEQEVVDKVYQDDDDDEVKDFNDVEVIGFDSFIFFILCISSLWSDKGKVQTVGYQSVYFIGRRCIYGDEVYFTDWKIS